MQGLLQGFRQPVLKLSGLEAPALIIDVSEALKRYPAHRRAINRSHDLKRL
jgi:hypothetical protein